MLSPFVPWSADECINAFECEGEKPHQGVAGKNPALHPGITWSNSTTALGLRGARLETRVRSRCNGKERDSESNLDNFGARYLASSLGRFMTPDWAARATAVPYAVFGDPQTLNLYTYVENAPLNRIDADGHLGGIDNHTQTECPGGKTKACKQKAQKKKDPPKTEPKPGEKHKGEPYSATQTGVRQKDANRTIYNYQVTDPTGAPVKGDMTVHEHITTVFKIGDNEVKSGDIDTNSGRFGDSVGLTFITLDNSFLKTEQTFSVTKDGQEYNLTTKVNQYISNTNGQETSAAEVVVP